LLIIRFNNFQGKKLENNVYTFGIAFFYFGYTNAGKYLYLEDFFIKEQYCGRGYGKNIRNILANAIAL
jgi:hypothetical protein